MPPIISVEHLSKAYRLGQIGVGTVDLGHLLYSFGFILAVVFLGCVISNRLEQTFMDAVWLMV